jgi:hypothetical protein
MSAIGQSTSPSPVAQQSYLTRDGDDCSSPSSGENSPSISPRYTPLRTNPVYSDTEPDDVVENDSDKINSSSSSSAAMNKSLTLKSARCVGDSAQFVGKNTRIIAKSGSGASFLLGEMYRQMQTAGVDELVVVGPARGDENVFPGIGKTKIWGKENIDSVCKWALEQTASGKRVAVVFYNCFGAIHNAIGRAEKVRAMFINGHNIGITIIVYDQTMVLAGLAHSALQFDRVLLAQEGSTSQNQRIYNSISIPNLTFVQFSKFLRNLSDFKFLLINNTSPIDEPYWYKADLANQPLPDSPISSSYIAPEVKVPRSQLEVLEEISAKLSKLEVLEEKLTKLGTLIEQAGLAVNKK